MRLNTCRPVKEEREGVLTVQRMQSIGVIFFTTGSAHFDCRSP